MSPVDVPAAVAAPVRRCATRAGCAAALVVSLLASPASAQGSADARVLELARKEKPALVETLRELVEIESGSHDKAGLDRLADRLRGKLEALGAKTEIIDPNPVKVKLVDTPAAVGKAVVGRWEGRGTKRIMLMAHMDTVYAPGVLAKRPFRVEGNRAYGPGIADDKGGIAVILHTLAIWRTLGWQDYRTLTVVINGDEEISTPGMRDAFARLGSEHDHVFSFEPTVVGKDGIAGATSGIAAATLKVTGKSAHAGVNPEQGRNALIELSHQLLQSRDLSDPAKGIKFNWTLAKAGSVRNVIPEEASAAADVRVQRLADYDAIEKAFIARVSAGHLVPDTKVEPSFERRRPPLEATAAGKAIADKAKAIYAELGRTLGYDDSGRGGGTDAAFAALSGKPTVLESFGLPGYGYHSSEEEYVDLDGVEPRLYLATRLITDVAAGR